MAFAVFRVGDRKKFVRLRIIWARDPLLAACSQRVPARKTLAEQLTVSLNVDQLSRAGGAAIEAKRAPRHPSFNRPKNSRDERKDSDEKETEEQEHERNNRVDERERECDEEDEDKKTEHGEAEVLVDRSRDAVKHGAIVGHPTLAAEPS